MKQRFLTSPIDAILSHAFLDSAMSRLLSLCGLVCGLIGLAGFFILALGYSRGPSDFVQDYAAGHALRHGQPIYGMSFPRYAESLLGFSGYDNFHPPTIAVYFWPISYLPYDIAFVIWSCISLCLYGAMVHLSVREFALPISSIVLIGIGLVWRPFIYAIEMGQLSLIIAGAVLGGWILLRRGSPVVAGALLGFAAAIKLFPGILGVYLVAKREWSALLAMTTVVVVSFVAAGYIVGIEQSAHYFTTVIPQNIIEWAIYPLNASLHGYLLPALTPNAFIAPLIELPFATARGIVQGISVCLGGVVAWRTLYLIKNNESDRAFCLLVVAMILLSPISWLHIFPILIPVLAYLFSRSKHPRERAVWYLSIVLLALPHQALLSSLVRWYTPAPTPAIVFLLTAFPTHALLLLLWWCTRTPGAKKESPL